VSITEDAPAKAPAEPRAPAPRSAAWWWLVAACALVLLTVAVVLAVWWAASSTGVDARYRVLGDLAAIRLDLGDADVEVAGGGTAVEVLRMDRYVYGARARERRTVDGGALTIRSRCPELVFGSCRVRYRLTVPDNVPIEVETVRGNVTLTGVRASVRIVTGRGAITATGFCGFSLRATSDDGDVRAASECSADRLELRSQTGDVRAVVPAGRYQVDAQSDTGSVRVRALQSTDDAPFQIQAASGSGDVLVEAAS
jgi:hypothetical protein